jgi:hypothetical protein
VSEWIQSQLRNLVLDCRDKRYLAYLCNQAPDSTRRRVQSFERRARGRNPEGGPEFGDGLGKGGLLGKGTTEGDVRV